jgi:hypothetical protein
MKTDIFRSRAAPGSRNSTQGSIRFDSPTGSIGVAIIAQSFAADRPIVNWVSADGYFAGRDGTLDWLVPDEGQARAAAEDIPKFDTVLFGRRTYEIFEGF